VSENERFHWEETLLAAISPAGLVRHVIVIDEVDSTQDEARRRDVPEGTLAVALRQSRGRGRLGRSWHDTGNDGVAVTAVLSGADPSGLSLGCALAAARAIEANVPARVGIKWPNDLMIAGRKVGGVLIEIAGSRAWAGVGINVSQTAWPRDLAGRAISLLEAGHVVERLAIVRSLVTTLSDALRESEAALLREFAERDVLTGRAVTVENDRIVYSGLLLAIDPFRSLTMQTESGRVTLPAMTTRIISMPAITV
jgi:BirA family biotin operon repressor/biotin-[acetyl-CoA-carboxylase] ligase